MAHQSPTPEPLIRQSTTAGAGDEPPPVTRARFDCADWAAFNSTSLLAFLGYVLTLSPNVTLEFSGLLSTGAMYAGVTHPPGYPVWTLYSWLWIKLLPVANVAWRVAVGSAAAAAVACGLVAMMLSYQGKILLQRTLSAGPGKRGELIALRVVCGSAAGLVLAFSGAVWHKAVIADIWALSLLLFNGAMFLLVRWLREPGRTRYLCGAFFLVGLLLTSNQELIAIMPGLAGFVMLGNPKLGRDASLVVLPLAVVLATRSQYGIWLDPYFMHFNGPLLAGFVVMGVFAGVVALKTRGIGTEWRAAMLGGLCLLLGIAFYWFVPVAAMTNPPVNHGYARTVEGFEHLLARGQYERVRSTADFVSFLKQLWLYVHAAGREFGWLQLGLASMPFVLLRRSDPMNRKWLFSLLAVFAGAGPVLLAMLNPSSDVQSIDLIKPYFAASYAVVSLWFGFGLLLIGGFFASSIRK